MSHAVSTKASSYKDSESTYKDDLKEVISKFPFIRVSETVARAQKDIFAGPRVSYLFLGTGVTSSKEVSQGLPFDAVGYMVAAIFLAKELDLNGIIHVIADEHATVNVFASNDAHAIAVLEKEQIERAIVTWGLSGFYIVHLASEYFREPEFLKMKDEVARIVEISPPNQGFEEHASAQYLTNQVADIRYMNAKYSVGMKLSWCVSGKKHYHDEFAFDTAYLNLFKLDRMSFAYCIPGTTANPNRPSVSPYTFTKSDEGNRLPISHDVSVVDFFNNLKSRRSNDDAEEHRAIERVFDHMQCIVDLFELHVMKTPTNLALIEDKVQFIINTFLDHMSVSLKSPISDSSSSSLSTCSSASTMEVKASDSIIAAKVEIACSVGLGGKITGKDELYDLFARKERPRVYDGFEPSGRMHIAQGFLRAINVNAFLSIGCEFILYVADWFAQLNKKMSGDLDKIKIVGLYMIEVWKAVGMDTDKVEFVWASDLIEKDKEYWPLVMHISSQFTVKRIQKCGPIMGRNDTENLYASQIFYPCMQCADISRMQIDICQLGIDQEKVNMLAREYAKVAKISPPIIISHRMVKGLKEGQEKMSKSDPDSAIFMEDEEHEVNRKITKAFCPPFVTENNPVFDYAVTIVMGYLGYIEVMKKVGEQKDPFSYNTREDLKSDYENGLVDPIELKKSVKKSLNEMLQPVRDHFKQGRAGELLELVKSYNVTR